MMRKYFVLTLTLFLQLATAMAVPAHKGATRVMQPDGTYVTIRLHGDEYLHFNTTDDGYSVVKDNRGYYVYATLDANGRLMPTSQTAHETAMRESAELDFLKDKPKMLCPAMSKQMEEKQATDRARRAQRLAQAKAGRINYSKFRGLILLVEYNDKSFKYANYRDLMDEMANKENYKGNSITNVDPRRNAGMCTGSIRDFYEDSSNGQFIPEFDVVGPIKINHSQYDIKWPEMQESKDFSRLYQFMADVANAADPVVDFSKYDANSDGIVDLVYIIFAGMSSNFSGNDDRLMWPHQSDFVNPNSIGYLRKDNVRLGHYACSTELYGTTQWSTLNGIGTITHEFGHVLGLPDFYDTDYGNSGGESSHPGEWTVMAGGGYLNYGRTPAVYTLFERYALGWAMPRLIDGEGPYTIQSIDESNSGYRLNSRVNKEFFMLENRQQTKWNEYLPGHGLLVFRVDSTNSTVWNDNTVNANPVHNYFEMVRAGGFTGLNEADSDPFPGSYKVTTLSNTTSPGNLKTWSGKHSPWALWNIAENNGVITFDIVSVNVLFNLKFNVDDLLLAKGFSYKLQVLREPDEAPYSLTWTSSNDAVCTVDANGLVTAKAPGTATITVSDNGENHCKATCTVTVADAEVATDIADCKQKEEGKEVFLLLDKAQVLYIYNGNIYLRDGSGAMVLNNMGFSDIKKGNLLSGFVYGRYVVADRMPQLQAVSGRTSREMLTITEGQEVVPREIYAGDLRSSDYADLLTLKAVHPEYIDGLTGLFAVEGKNQVRIYNTFGLKSVNSKVLLDEPDARYDITGILRTGKINNQVIDEIAMTVTPTKTVHEPYVDSAISDASIADNIDGITEVYTIDGRRVDTMKSGLYIVRMGSKTLKVLQK